MLSQPVPYPTSDSSTLMHPLKPKKNLITEKIRLKSHQEEDLYRIFNKEVACWLGGIIPKKDFGKQK